MKVSITIKSQEVKFPGGTVGGQWHIDVARAATPGDVEFDYEGPSTSAEFDLQDGVAYIARGYRLDAADATLGPVAQTQFTAGEDLVPIDVAETISATTLVVMPAKSPAKK
jgi:hypothetical protein